MNAISLHEALEAELAQLERQWDGTRAGWDDRFRRAFEEKVVMMYLERTPRYLAELRQIASLLEEAERSIP